MDIRDMKHSPWESLDEKRMSATIWVDLGNDDEELIDVPLHFAVCHVCEGRGSHVSPGIDSHGLSSEDFAEDPDFAEDYRSGFYDVPCSCCGGQRVKAEADFDRLDKQTAAAVQDAISEYYVIQAENQRQWQLGY